MSVKIRNDLPEKYAASPLKLKIPSVILGGDLFCGGNCAEAFYIFEGALLEGGEGVGKAGDVFFGKVAVLAVYHVAHVAGIYEEGFADLLFAAGDKPEGYRNCYAVEKLGWHGDNFFY